MVHGATAGERASVHSASPPAETDGFLIWLVYATVALFPLTAPTRLWASDGPGNSFTLEPYELVLIVLVLASAARAIEERHVLRPVAWSVTTRLAAAATVAWSLSLAVHPSWKGLDLALGLAGAWAVGWVVHRSTPAQKMRFLWVVVSVGGIEAVLGAAQSLSRGLVGLPALEAPVQVGEMGGLAAAVGSTTNQNSLGALLVSTIAAGAVLCLRSPRVEARWVLLGASTVMAFTTSLTFSRAAVLAIVPMLILLAITSSAARRVALAIGIGIAAGWIVAHDAAGHVVEETTDSRAYDSGRRPLVTEAIGVIGDQPTLGVGPGRYVMSVGEGVHGTPMPPHNVVLHVAAESGIPAALVLVASMSGLASRLWRSGTLALVAGVSLAPFLLLHTFPYASHPVLLGVWLATVSIAADTHASNARGRLSHSAASASPPR